METPKSKLAYANGLPLDALFCVQEDLTNPGNFGVWELQTAAFISAPVMTEPQAELFRAALNTFFRLS